MGGEGVPRGAGRCGALPQRSRWRRVGTGHTRWLRPPSLLKGANRRRPASQASQVCAGGTLSCLKPWHLVGQCSPADADDVLGPGTFPLGHKHTPSRKREVAGCSVSPAPLGLVSPCYHTSNQSFFSPALVLSRTPKA